MALAQSRLTAQGQISVPAEIRKKLGIGPGSVIEWDEEGGRLFVRRAARYSMEDIHRTLFSGRRPPRKTDRELREGIRAHIRKKHAGG
jgi:antitoxin PrlF